MLTPLLAPRCVGRRVRGGKSDPVGVQVSTLNGSEFFLDYKITYMFLLFRTKYVVGIPPVSMTFTGTPSS